MLIAGDIGGTKTNLALFNEGKWERFATFPSQKYPSLTAILLEYLHREAQGLTLTGGCFAVAGPVVNGVCKVTNLPWIVSLKELIAESKIASLSLINDLEAGAYAIDALPQTALCLLHEGKKQGGNRALISPGTGLGEAGVFWHHERHFPFPSEGGHSDFAPLNDLQVALWSYMQKKVGHLSYDRILSGSGLIHLYHFFLDVEKREEPAWLKDERANENFAATITQNALNGRSPLCNDVLDLYVEILGQEAANAALKFMAIGGVYLGGGIPPKILPRLEKGPFLKGFLNKGRFRPFLENIAVTVILDDKASLHGAALYTSLIKHT